MTNPQFEEHELFRLHPCARTALWSPKAFDATGKVESFGELVPIAIAILQCFEEPVTVVSGPISTGGFDDIKLNMQAFTNAIRYLQTRKRSVLDQTPFETAFVRLIARWRASGGSGYPMPILNEFYGPVFRSGLITTVAFMQGWESSFGSQWEYREAREIGLGVEHLPLIKP
jgi:hypothetical protein